jgi:hypothetical protein
MTDVVVKLPLATSEEAQLFGDFLNRFMESQESDAELGAAGGDAPFLMVRSDPQAHAEVKVVIFQERAAAQAFSKGWALARNGLGIARAG